ncbi:fungal-specific transcription factor domain-containing protein, partial [Mariannaea sp. PMI_226]
ACDSCRKKKTRCQPTKEGCVQCSKHQLPCHFTPIKTQRQPRRPQGFLLSSHKHIRALEGKLKQLEGLLEDARHLNNPDLGSSNIDMGFSFWPWCQNTTAGMISPSSFTPLAPVPAYTSLTWKDSLALGPFSRPSFHKLPSESVALELIDDTFKSFNNFFPLFDEGDFRQQFHQNYRDCNRSNPAWWACVNVVFSLAHRFRAMRILDAHNENFESCGYIHNALAVVSEISILHHSLPAIQALVGMATILQGTPNPEPASVLIAAAVRLAQAMGLHRKTQDLSLSKAQVEQRRRVFWIAYYMDRDISLRMGVPFAQDDEDMDAELPAGNLSTISQFDDKPQTIDFFNSRVGIAVIQGQIYKRLYSVQATRQSDMQRAAVARELDLILSYWRNSVRLDYDNNSAPNQHASFTIEFLHLLILRATYVNCLIMIGRNLSPQEQLLADAESLGAWTPSEKKCVVESRKALHLVRVTPQGDYACVWLLLHPFFAAVTTLLENVIRYPNSAQAHSDLHVVEPFLGLLEVLANDEKQCSRSDEAGQMLRTCAVLHDRAKVAVEMQGREAAYSSVQMV